MLCAILLGTVSPIYLVAIFIQSVLDPELEDSNAAKSVILSLAVPLPCLVNIKTSKGHGPRGPLKPLPQLSDSSYHVVELAYVEQSRNTLVWKNSHYVILCIKQHEKKYIFTAETTKHNSVQ